MLLTMLTPLTRNPKLLTRNEAANEEPEATEATEATEAGKEMEFVPEDNVKLQLIPYPWTQNTKVRPIQYTESKSS